MSTSLRQLRLIAWPLLVMAGLALLALRFGGPWQVPELTREQRWQAEGKLLLRFDYTLTPLQAARSLRVPLATLAEYPLYLRPANSEAEYLLVAADGQVTSSLPRREAWPAVRDELEILLTPETTTLFADGALLARLPVSWTLYWVARAPGQPTLSEDAPMRFSQADGFMRTQLVDEYWRPITGKWGLEQHGGGMPTNAAELINYNFQRAVNPFSVTGQGGELLYQADPWPAFYAEVRWYFGQPRTGNVTDLQTLPDQTRMLVALADERHLALPPPDPKLGAATGLRGGTPRLWGKRHRQPAFAGEPQAAAPPLPAPPPLPVKPPSTSGAILPNVPLPQAPPPPAAAAVAATPGAPNPATTSTPPPEPVPFAPRYAFGWLGEVGAFGFVGQRVADGPWETLQVWQGGRPPVSSWVRVGLALRDGSLLEGFVDGVKVLTLELNERVSGPVSMLAGTTPVEVDDFRVCSLPEPARAGLPGSDPTPAWAGGDQWQPVMTKSRFFAGKNLKGGADPTQFSQWAKSSDTFVAEDQSDPDGKRWKTMLCRLPLMADFDYESLPFADGVGALPDGSYRMVLRRQDPAEPLLPAKSTPVLTLNLTRAKARWVLTGQEPTLWPADHEAFALRLARRGEQLWIEVGATWKALPTPVPGPLFWQVALLQDGRSETAFGPRPEHHALSSTRLYNEFFEEAPTDWSWVEGAFRMDCRWACQNEWNFMACGGVGTPHLVSRRRYLGDQEHEFFMSLRPVFPWDAGDKTFDYHPSRDPGFSTFGANQGWYNRHDLNFSFCTDGRNPLSGYALIFAGNENQETLLLRRGVVVARSDKHYIARDGGHGAIHWQWWNFQVSRYGDRIRVLHNKLPVFDYQDPEPLPGGHLGFWTVRNGFTISRLISTASEAEWAPHVLFVPPSQPSPWQALQRDTVTLTPAAEPGLTRVTMNTGAGFQAVRWQPEKPINLAATPVLDLPMHLGPGSRLTLFLDLGGQSFLVELNGPLTDMKELLTPSFEAAKERFRIPVLTGTTAGGPRHLIKADPESPRLVLDLAQLLKAKGVTLNPNELRSLTFGNTSNTDYLLAGSTGNQAGCWYELGEPRFLPAPQP